MHSEMQQTSHVTLKRQGSFYVGGREVRARGEFDATAAPLPGNEGQTFWVDQMYVQYQVPVAEDRLPIVLVHGGGGTGRVWESTPDGREGYQTILLRQGFPVYIVDTPHGGRSGFPSFIGQFGWLDENAQVVPNHTFRVGQETAWSRWRLGPRYPEVFPNQAFPMEGLDQFMRHMRPVVAEDPDLVSGALVSLLEAIGPAILVTHSNSGVWGWLSAARSPHVKAIVSYEPGFVFPEDEFPSPTPLYKGEEVAGMPISNTEFNRLSSIPIQVVYGDNIPEHPIPDLIADGRRAQVIQSELFVAAINQRGGRASVLHLPEVGLHGNSHFPFSDLNNIDVADQLAAFLTKHGVSAKSV
jgi:pimeloyl-ACP methyl ester carboxylesterase